MMMPNKKFCHLHHIQFQTQLTFQNAQIDDIFANKCCTDMNQHEAQISAAGPSSNLYCTTRFNFSTFRELTESINHFHDVIWYYVEVHLHRWHHHHLRHRHHHHHHHHGDRFAFIRGRIFPFLAAEALRSHSCHAYTSLSSSQSSPSSLSSSQSSPLSSSSYHTY